MSRLGADIDRESFRVRPEGAPLVRMWWSTLAFLHWKVEPDAMQALLPEGLEVDTHGGSAYVGVVPFTMRGVRYAKCPPLPKTHKFHEMNVRTYVVRDGVPGVWFFSLDAANRLAVRAARLAFGLPYFDASMSLERSGNRVRYFSRRTHSGAARAMLSVVWEIGEALPKSEPGSLEYFLTERYCLYAMRKKGLCRGRIFHQPWELRKASVELGSYQSTMIAATGLAEPQDEPIVHYSEEIETEAWGLEKT